MLKFSLFLLRNVVRPDYLEDIEGDLSELYDEKRNAAGKMIAGLFVFSEVVKLIRWPLIGRQKKYGSTPNAMLFNYFKVSFRNLIKYQGSSVLNVLGLSFGLAVCALCYLHIQFELGFDQFHLNKDHIFRITAGNPNDEHWVKVAAPIPPELKNQVPEIKDYIRFNSVSYNPKVLVEYQDKSFLEPYFVMTDPAFFKAFTFETIAGDPYKSLLDLNTVVTTESIARKLFGDTPALGKIIRLKDDQLDFQVGAVVADAPDQSHIKFDYLVSFENIDRLFGKGSSNSWGQFNWYAYLLLNENANVAEAQKKMQAISVSLPDSQQISFEGLFLQPLTDIHFSYNRGNQQPSYDKKYIYVFLTIAISLLAIACINYINLSIALSIKRIKEIGVRKAVGASRSQLIYQFINEAIVTSFVALAVGLLILHSVLPSVNSLFDSSMKVNYNDLSFLSFLAFTTLFVGLVSGSYLAFYVNRFKASSILKGELRNQSRGLNLQRVLVLIQFSISVILIACSFIITSQMNFLLKKNLGFNDDMVISMPVASGTSNAQLQTLKEELKKSNYVSAASATSFVPGKANWHQTVWWEGQEEPISMFIISIDKDFLSTMQIELTEGNMEAIASREGDQFILNESAIATIGWDTGLGKMFSPFGEGNKQGVAAVVKDFNFMSLHHQVAPLVLIVTDRFSLDQIFVRINASDLPAAISQVENTFQEVLGDVPFEFTFLDESINNLYKSEMQVQSIVTYLTIIAVFFALFGVYGLISFNIENRTKEIAIRKVLGITPQSLITLFSKRYYQLMLIASILSVPIVWKVMSEWLQNFSYRIDLNPLWFGVSFILVMTAITIIGVLKYLSIQKINPANALKYE